MSRQLRLDVAQLTDVGRKRPHNEDNMAYVIPKDEQAMARKGALFIVADGMGGHAAGEVASEIAVDTVTKAYYEDENEDIPLSLINAIKRANTIIHQRADENALRSGMGTTCVAAVMCGNVAYIANVGDSRAYIVRQAQVRQISQDHSWVEEQVRAGLLTHDQARSHAQRNVITRCLGTQTDVDVDVFSEFLAEGDTILLCTDGLSGSIAEDDLYTILNQFVPQESVYHLIERANENGGPDNITAIVAHVLEVGAEQPLARYPVPAGSHEVDMNTAVLGRATTSVLGVSSRSEDGPRWSASIETTETETGPLPVLGSSASVSSASLPQHQPSRRRLLYPTVAIIVLIIVLFGSSAFYVVHSLNNSTTQLSSARSLIDRANTEATQNPVDAIKLLSQAQNALLSAQGPLLVGDQASQYNSLQTSLGQALQKVMTAYNRNELISQLQSSCAVTQPLATNGSIQPTSLSVLEDATGNVYSYVLAGDENLYQVDNQSHLTNLSQVSHVINLTGYGQNLFALTASHSGNDTTYNLNSFSIGQSQTLTPNNQVTPDTKGWSPTILTAFGNDVYIVLASKTAQHQTKILDYDSSNWQNPPQIVQVSLDLVSVAAFDNKQLFLLTNDGQIKLLQLGSGGATSQPQDVSLQNPVSPPLANDATNFHLSTPIATPSSQSSPLGTSSASGSSFLAVSSVSGNVTLYVADNANQRIIKLAFSPQSVIQTQPTPGATPTPTSSNGGGTIIPPTLTVLQQFASSGNLLSSVKSETFATASDGQHLYLLTNGGSAFTTISSIDKAPFC